MTKSINPQLKRSSVAGKVPVAADLLVGQLAVNLADKTLFTKDASNAIIQVGGSAKKYAREVHVDPTNGVDTATGAYEAPVKTIAQALTLIGNGGGAIFLHSDGNSENVTVTNTNIDFCAMNAYGGITNLTGTWTFSHTTSSIRVHGLTFNSAVSITGAGSFYAHHCSFGDTFTKSGGGYMELHACELQGTGISVTGSGMMTLFGSLLANLTVNNAIAQVTLQGCLNATTITNTLGTLLVKDSFVFAATNGAAAITAAAGSVSYLINASIVQPDATNAKVNFPTGSFYSINTSIYNKASSTLAGTNLGTVTQTDALNVAGNLTALGNIHFAGPSTVRFTKTSDGNIANVSAASFQGGVGTNGNGFIFNMGSAATDGLRLNGSGRIQGPSGGVVAIANTTTLEAAQNFSIGTVVSNSAFKLFGNDGNTSNIKSVTIYPGNAMTANYSMVLPPNIATSNGQVLTANTDGKLTWTTPAAGSSSNITNGTTSANIGSANGNISMTVANTAIANVTSTGITITSNTASNSNTSGALVVGGGVGIAGSLNIAGNISASQIYGTLATADQTNISSLGNLTALTMAANANVKLGDVANVHITGGSNNQVLTTDGNGNLSWATAAGSYGNANVNILLASGNVPNLTIATANLHITGGSNLQVLTTDGNGNVSWANAASPYGDANVGAYMANYSGNLGNVTNLTVTGTLNLGPTSNIPVANASNVYYSAVIDSTGALVKEPTVASLSPVNDNTLTTPPSSPAVGDAYLVPATGATGAWLNKANQIATWDGAAWVFYTPATGDTTSVLTGTNAGKTYTYSGTAWVVNTSPTYSGLPLYNWVNTSSYTTGTVVVKANALYQTNGAIAANTAFTIGTTGNTYRELAVGKLIDANGVSRIWATANVGNAYWDGNLVASTNNTSILFPTNNSAIIIGSKSSNISAASSNSQVLIHGIGSNLSIGTDANSNAVMYVGTSANSNASLYVNGSKLEGVSYTGDYIQVAKAGSQTYTASTAFDVIFDQQATNGITYNTSTGVFSLKAGRTYRLSFQLGVALGSASGFQQYQWVDASNAALVNNTLKYAMPTTFASNYATSPSCEIIYTPSVDTNVKVRCSSNNDTSAGSVLAGSSAQVSEVGAGRQYYFNDYAKYNISTNSTINATTFVVPFDTTLQSSGGITVAAGVITLPAGKTYELAADLYVFNTNPQMTVAWQYGNGTAISGGTSTLESPTYTGNEAVGGHPTAIVTTTTATTVRLVITQISGIGTILGSQTYATVKQLGASAITGNVTIGGGGTSNINGSLTIKDTAAVQRSVGYKVSGYQGVGSFLTLDGIDVQAAVSGNASLQFRNSTGTATSYNWTVQNIRAGISSSTATSGTVSGTFTYFDSSINLNNGECSQTIILADRSNNRMYRITAMFPANNTTSAFISIERL